MALDQKKPTEKHTGIKLTSIRFDASLVPEGDKPVWVQVAKSGDYKGYDPPFELSADHFQEMVHNLRRHPSYKAGTDGIGTEDVVAWDFEHLSNPKYYNGDTAIVGAPAQGWVQDLQVRMGADGRSELWALTRWLDTARAYIKDGQYKSASISFDFDCEDPITDENVGATLLSIAITNDPFIQGMQPLAAKKQIVDETIDARRFSSADNIEEALEYIKEVFGLPELTDMDAVVFETDKLKQFVNSGSAPLGVDMDDIVGNLRKILNLPALSSNSEVLEELDKLIPRLQAEQSAPIPILPGSIMTSQKQTAASLAGAGGKKMEELLKVLAEALGVNHTEAEVKAAVQDSATLRAELRQHVSADQSNTKVLLEAVKKVVKDHGETKESFVALSRALAAKDGEDPIARVTTLLKAETDLGELRPKYEALEAEAKKAEEVRIESEVDRAMRQHNLAAPVRDALILSRRNDPESFAKNFPLTEEKDDHLLDTVATGVKPAEPGSQEAIQLQRPVAGTIDLTQYAGVNDSERMAQHILATNPSAKEWDRTKLYAEVNRQRSLQAKEVTNGSR